MTDYVLAARRYLAAQAPVRAVLGSDALWDTWLFQMKLQATLEGSESVACVLSPGGNWTTPNEHNTARFPRLRVEFFADPTRDAARNVVTASTWAKLSAAYDAIDPYLHWMGGEQMWGDVRVIGSKRLGELDYSPVQDGDGGGYAVVYYGLVL
jgi:hypothetical protein